MRRARIDVDGRPSWGEVDGGTIVLRDGRSVSDADATYLPQYLMAGQTLVEAGRPSDAREWLEAGVALARSQGEMKTLGELEGALGELD